MKKIITSILAAVITTGLLSGCGQQVKSNDVSPVQDNGGARLILPQAMEQKAIKLENVQSIKLYSLEGNVINKSFTDKEIEDIVSSYNKSQIDDTSYIESITGNRMVISFKDATKINIHSYGSETYVVASGEKITYHLAAPEIAAILLKKF
jgi:outer membrane murein-binding lipoprotein Lpp